MSDTFVGWAIVELMGHRRLAGHVTEEDHFGTAMLRLDVYGLEGDAKVTQMYGGSAVYCVTPTTEDIARKIGATSTPAPVARYELEPPRRDPWDGADEDDYNEGGGDE